MSQPLLVTGMHRSGTSLIASLLRRGGVFMGETLVAPGSANPRGFFEDVDFLRFHEGALLARGLTLIARPDFTFEATADERARAETLLQARADQENWGWKDPRSALFLDFWRTLLPEMRVLAVYRHPLDVLMSMIRRKDLYAVGLLEVLDAWHTYNTRILAQLDRHPRRCVLLHAYGFVDRLADAQALLKERLGISLSLSPEDLASIYQPDELRRLSFCPEVTQILEAVHPSAMAVFRQLEARADLPAPVARPQTGDDHLSELARHVERNPTARERPASRAILLSLCSLLNPAATENLCAHHQVQLAELERANHWYKQQVDNWQNESQRLSAHTTEQGQWIAELERARDGLSERAQTLEARIQELETWQQQLEEGKRWLESHAAAWERTARDFEGRLVSALQRLEALEKVVPVDLREGLEWAKSP